MESAHFGVQIQLLCQTSAFKTQHVEKLSTNEFGERFNADFQSTIDNHNCNNTCKFSIRNECSRRSHRNMFDLHVRVGQFWRDRVHVKREVLHKPVLAIVQIPHFDVLSHFPLNSHGTFHKRRQKGRLLFHNLRIWFIHISAFDFSFVCERFSSECLLSFSLYLVSSSSNLGFFKVRTEQAFSQLVHIDHVKFPLCSICFLVVGHYLLLAVAMVSRLDTHNKQCWLFSNERFGSRQ